MFGCLSLDGPHREGRKSDASVFEKIPTLNSPPLPPEMPANRGNLALGCLSRLAEMRENATNI